MTMGMLHVLNHELVLFMFELQSMLSSYPNKDCRAVFDTGAIQDPQAWHSHTGRCESCSTVSRVDDDGAAGL